jgi:predicted RecB family nuclease
MQYLDGSFFFSPSDLTNFLACDYLINQEIKVAKDELKSVYTDDPMLKELRRRGQEFEDRYVAHLSTTRGVLPCNLKGKDFDATKDAMQRGEMIIVQARLENSNWRGFADILVRNDVPSDLGNWSYEVMDTKLSSNTRNSAVLQLCFYTDVVSLIQVREPEEMRIIKPKEDANGFREEVFRFAEFKAYYNQIQNSLVTAVANPKEDAYPESVEHCSICNWWKHCRDKRREDDHLSLVAGMRSSQIITLNEQGVRDMTSFANRNELDKPSRGNLETLRKKQQQARIQVSGKGSVKPITQLLPLPKEERSDYDRDEHGFNLLPERSEGDIYFDFEGDAFYPNGGIEYLFGWIYKYGDTWKYDHRLARNHIEEKKAFQEFMCFVGERMKKYPDLCIYHFAPKEPTSFKRLMRFHGCHEDDVNRLLRGLRFVDLHVVARKSFLASVERYSLKDLEKLTDYERIIDLDAAGTARRRFELALNTGNLAFLSDDTIRNVIAYNEDDCRATLALHNWIEEQRKKVEHNAAVHRLEINDGEQLKEDTRKERGEILELYRQLTEGLPEDRDTWTAEDKAKCLLANVLNYFQREYDSALWEYFATLKKLPEELGDARNAITGLILVESIPPKKANQNRVDVYEFPEQEIDMKEKQSLTNFSGRKKIGTIANLDKQNLRISISRSKAAADEKLFAVVASPDTPPAGALTDSLKKIAHACLEKGLGGQFPYHAAADLLMKSKPRFTKNFLPPFSTVHPSLIESAIDLVKNLDQSVLALQGPPGTGKTHTGAEMIISLWEEGKRIGVTAVSHKAYQNLMKKVQELAGKKGVDIPMSCKPKADCEPINGIQFIDGKTQTVHDALDQRHVVGGVAWLWATDDTKNELDYLFVDEAGQMSLTYVLATSRSARNIVLLGDPNQLEQPQKGTHPEGSDVAALEHLLDGHKTMPDDRGIFMNITRRLHPNICRFTSEQFYEGKLRSLEGLERQLITGNTKFSGSGLFYEPVTHTGNQTRSTEEVTRVINIIAELLHNGSYMGRPLQKEDILIVAPYNNQVNALKAALQDFRIGTVDKFQGQEAPVVIYSMAASTAEDAPRGMKFLYDPFRFNVATSRALSVCILVACPTLMLADCRTIDQMKWVNVLCRYKELARTSM